MNTLEAARLNYIIESSSRISEIKDCLKDINKVQTIENTESLKGSRNMHIFFSCICYRSLYCNLQLLQ